MYWPGNKHGTFVYLWVNQAEHEQTQGKYQSATEFVVSAKSMFQLVSTGDIIGRVQVIDLLVFIDIVVL